MLCPKCNKNEATTGITYVRGKDQLFYSDCIECQRKEDRYFKVYFVIMTAGLLAYLYGILKLVSWGLHKIFI